MEKSEAALAAAKEKLQEVTKRAELARAALQSAEASFNQALSKFDAERGKARVDLCQDLKLGLGIDALAMAENNAEVALGNAKADAVEADPSIPLGAKYRQLKQKWKYSGNMVPCGKVGVLQVYRPGDPWPESATYRRPDGGDLIIRHLKKDGSPAIAADIVSGSWVRPGPVNWARPTHDWERCDEQ